MTLALRSGIDSIDPLMAQVRRYPVLTREEELKLARRLAQTGDVDAAHRLVVHNLRFVVKIAHSYRQYGLKLLDLVQEGSIGLMMAVKKFDPERGYRLISYAVWWIRAYMQSFIMRSWSLVRMGSSRLHRKLFFRLKKERAKAQQEASGGELDKAALAERLGVTEDEIDDMELRLAGQDFSLDAELKAGAPATHLDRVEEAAPSPEDEAIATRTRLAVRSKVRGVLKLLNPRERDIVERRLLADNPETLQQLGDNLGVSRERVRQLEARVKDKLKNALSRSETVCEAVAAL